MNTSGLLFKRRLGNQNGSALIMSMLTLTVVAIAGFSVAKMSSADVAGSAQQVSVKKAEYWANAGLQAALHNIQNPTIGSPNIGKVTMSDGSAFTVSANPSTRTITSIGTSGEASKTLSINTDFAADCFAIDFGNANYTNYQGWGKLGNVTLRKSCSEIDQVQVKEMRVLYSNPHPGRLVQDLTFNDTTSVYHVPASIPGYPTGTSQVGLPSGGVQSKEVIDTQDYTFTSSASQSLSIWWNTTFTTSVPVQLQVVFVDGSSYTSAIKVLP